MFSGRKLRILEINSDLREHPSGCLPRDHTLALTRPGFAHFVNKIPENSAFLVNQVRKTLRGWNTGGGCARYKPRWNRTTPAPRLSE